MLPVIVFLCQGMKNILTTMAQIEPAPHAMIITAHSGMRSKCNTVTRFNIAIRICIIKFDVKNRNTCQICLENILQNKISILKRIK